MNNRLGVIRKLIFWGFLLYIFLLLAFSDTMGMLPLKLAGFKFYGADLILFFLVFVLLFYGVDSPFKTKVGLSLLVLLLFGFFNLVRGYLIGYGFNEVVGDFRRLYLYTIAFGITWVLLDSPGKLKTLNKVAYLAVIPLIALSLLRAYAGVSWNIKYEAEDMRAVSYASASVLFWVFFDASSRLLIRTKGELVFKNLFWVGVVGFTLVISNYRTLWLVPVMGMIILILSAKINGMMRIGRMLLAGILLATAGLLVVLVLRSVFRDIFGLIETKFIEDVLGFKWEGSFRYFSWGEAWSHFQTNPWLGVGIGHRMDYWLLNRFGEYYMRESTAHNIFIDYFYQTGLVGGLLYLVPHTLFVIELWRPLRRIPLEYSRPALVLFVTYISMFALGSLQPFLTIPSVAVFLYIIMGVALRWVYWGKRAVREELREDCVV